MQGLTRRRAVIGGASLFASGTVALVVGPKHTQANASVTLGKLEIPDKSKKVNDPVSKVRIAVDGQYEYQADVAPDKIVVRLEGTSRSEWTQLGAWDKRSPLKETGKGDFTINGNLLDLPGVTATGLSPSEPGKTKRKTVDLRLKMQVYDDKNGKLNTKTVSDTATIAVTKAEPGAKIELGGVGEITVSE